MSDGPTLAHDDIVGKAYDARLMRRLLTYLRPHVGAVAVAFANYLGVFVPWVSQSNKILEAGSVSFSSAQLVATRSSAKRRCRTRR